MAVWTSRRDTSSGPGGTIPVLRNNDDTDDSVMERKMDAEAASVLRQWDTNAQVQRETFRLRPKASPSNGPERRRKRLSSTGSSRATQTNTSVSDATFGFPEIDVTRREDTLFDTSGESVDEDLRLPWYATCPKTGRRIFRMEFDVTGYDRRNISVKVAGSRLVVHATQRQSVDGRKSTTEFCRRVKLPCDVDARHLSCTDVDGRLVIEAPLKVDAPPGGDDDSHSEEPLNTPVVKLSDDGGKTLHLLAEVGRVFHADDVIVQLKGNDRLLVSADRKEDSRLGKLSASLSREFLLPFPIEPRTLKAGMTTDGLLKVSANVVRDNDVTNVVVITDLTPNGNSK